MLNTIEITFNDHTSNWAIWFNGKIVKIAKRESTLLQFAKSKGWEI